MSRVARLAALAAFLLIPAAAWAQASPSPYTSATRYDPVGRVTGTISADPDGMGTGNPFLAVRNTYDQAGRLTKVETGTLATWHSEAITPASWTGFAPVRIVETQYGLMGRKTRETLREGTTLTIRGVTQYSYDSAGRLDCAAIRVNAADFASPPSSACSQGAGGQDRITRNFYDAADQRIQLRKGLGSNVEGAEATWAYNLNGQVVTVIDGNGNQARLVYDGHGRQNCWMFPSTTRAAAFNDATQATALATAGGLSGTITGGHCATGNFERYTVDPAGNRTELRKRDGRRIAYAYDNLNRVTQKNYPDGGATAVFYGYDLRNLQVYARYTSTSGQGVTNSYDGFGRLASQSSDMSGAARTLTYQYDRNGNRTRITHPDTQWFITGYDNLNRPTALVDALSVAVYYSYKDHGAPYATTRTNGASTFREYDGVQRPTTRFLDYPAAHSAWDVTWTYGYNAASGISSIARDNDAYAWTGHYAVQRAYTTNGRNQYSQTVSAGGTTTFGFDDNGNLTSETPPSPAPATTYTYDVENRLIGRTNGGVTLSYDPLGRLFQVSSTGGPTTQFLYDGNALIAEYVSGTMTTRYVHNVGADVPMVAYPDSSLNSPRWLHADHQGSIVATTNAVGAPVVHNSYDEYGIPAATNSGRFQYTGQIWLAELGMYHYKARIYSPTLGRFLQTDPVGYDDQINLYAYVGNDPVNLLDPSGRAIIHWVTNTEAKIEINWTKDERGGATMQASPEAVNDLMRRGMTGTANYGGDQVSFSTQAYYHAPGQTGGVPDLNTVEVYPDGQIPAPPGAEPGMGGGGRPYTTELGGNTVRVTGSEQPIFIAHELAPHTSGAADQYAGGIDINGSIIPTPSPYTEPSLAGGGNQNQITVRPNDRMMQQVFNNRDNIVTCAAGAERRCGK